MVSFCTECGTKLELNFKFCPICGSEINSFLVSPKLDEANSITAQVIVCTNCGEENSLESNVCNSCGVKLNKTKTASITISNNVKANSKVKIEKPKSKKFNKPQNKNKNESTVIVNKKLDSKKILAFVGISIGSVLLVLVASGVIDLSGSKTTPTVMAQQNQGSGIDLSSISKINELKNIAEKDPNNASAVLDLANLQFDSGFFEDAAKNYDQYLKLEPKNANARIDMAVCYYNMQQFDKAESEILTALKYSPNHQTGFLNLGVIYLAKQNMEKAKEWFRKTVEIDPNSEVGKKAKSLLESH
jgi:cytochrome c-type biogenesis protein CcmH/NrfG